MSEMKLDDFKNDEKNENEEKEKKSVKENIKEDNTENKKNDEKEVSKKDDTKIIDISNFKISDETKRLNEIISSDDPDITNPSVRHIIAGKCHEISLYKGLDIKKLQNSLYGENNMSDIEKLLSILKVFFNHLKTSKDISFNEWLQTITALDLEDIYAAIYRSTIYNEDTVLLNCDSCKSESLIVMDKTFEDLYMKFTSEEAKDDYMKLYNDSKLSLKDKNSSIVAINNKFAVEISLPSIYDDAIITKNILKSYPNIKKNFEEVLNYAIYINNIYSIENDELYKINMYSSKIKHNNTIEDDMNKMRLKLENVNKLLNAIDIDDINRLENAIRNIEDRKKEYTYVTPKAICPKCGETIESQEVTGMLDMVLLRINHITE